MFIYYIAKVLHWVFLVYTLMIFARLVGSWFPRFTYHPIMRFCRMYTDPYLNIFRRLIPPIGGALDLSPILAFFALNIMERLILGFLGALL